jgi:hypothetical protein
VPLTWKFLPLLSALSCSFKIHSNIDYRGAPIMDIITKSILLYYFLVLVHFPLVMSK